MGMSPRLLRPRATGGFSPKNISGLQLWLDATDSSTVTTVSGNVSEWRDKSGLGRSFAQTTANNRPALEANVFGSLSALKFDGANDSLASIGNSGAFVSPCSFFAVCKKPTAAADGGIFCHDLAANATWQSYDNSNLWCITTNSNGAAIRVLGAQGASLYPGVGAEAATLNSFIMSLVVSGANNSGVLRNRTAGLTDTDTDYLFAASPATNGCAVGVISACNGGAIVYFHNMNGYIAEIVAYSRVLSATEQTSVSDYLAKKYAL